MVHFVGEFFHHQKVANLPLNAIERVTFLKNE